MWIIIENYKYKIINNNEPEPDEGKIKEDDKEY